MTNAYRSLAVIATSLSLAPLSAQTVATQCAPRAAGTPAMVSRDSSGIRIIENWSASAKMIDWRIDPTPVSILGESSDPNALLGRVESATRLSTGEIVVADEQAPALKVFATSGSVARTIGGRGSGPGEFQRVTRMVRLAGDTIAVSDIRLRRVSYFDGAGKIVRSSQLPGVLRTDTVNGRELSSRTYLEFRGELRSGAIVGTRLDAGVSGEKPPGLYQRQSMVHLQMLGRDGKVTSLGQLVQNEYWELFKGGSIYFDDMPFTAASQYTVGGDAAFVTDGRALDVRQYSQEGQTKLIRLCRPPVAIDANRRAAFIKESLGRAQAEERTAYEEAYGKMRFPATFPAVSGLRVDASGRLWARAYVDNALSERWEAFDAAGRHLGGLVLPQRVSLLEMGNDHVLGRHLDADSVQTVRMYRVIK